jgi:dihydroorotase
MIGFSNVRLPDGTATSLLVEGGRIARIGGDIPVNAEVVDGKGKLLAPGIVDLGVFRVDGPAFRFGGIVRAALMPDQVPALDDPGLIQRAAYSGKPDIWVHPLAAATRSLEGQELAELGLMKAAGARAVATGRHWIGSSGVMYRVLSYAATFGLTVISHAEDEGLTSGTVATAGETATRLGLASAPASAEAMAIVRDLALCEETGAALHFRQVTTRAGLDLVRSAKRRGLPVTCGITPAHLYLSDTAISDFRTFAHLSPPLRSEADRLAAIEAVGDGTIDVIASGHDPRGPEDKRLPFADSAPGAAGAETLLALSLNLVRDGVIDLPRLFELLALNPSRILGLDGGRLDEGAPADLILVDPDAPWRVDSDKMRAAAGNTPFDKLPVQGRVLRLFKGGREIA